MAKFTLTLVDPEERVMVDVDARDRRRAELQLPVKVGRQGTPFTDLLQQVPDTATAFLCWSAYKREGGEVTWDTWLDRLVDYDLEEEPTGSEDPDPT